MDASAPSPSAITTYETLAPASMPQNQATLVMLIQSRFPTYSEGEVEQAIAEAQDELGYDKPIESLSDTEFRTLLERSVESLVQ